MAAEPRVLLSVVDVRDANGFAPERQRRLVVQNDAPYHLSRAHPRKSVSDSPPGSVRSRRDFIALLGTTAGGAWLATIWPPAIADASEAAEAAQQGQTPRYRALTSQQAEDFGAAADRIIPRDDAPGARDVGVVFFADHLLASFAPSKKPAFDAALKALDAAARKHVANAASF